MTVTRLAVVLGLVAVAAVVTVVHRRRARADEALGAHDDRGEARWPDLPAGLAAADRPTWVVLTTPYCASCDAVKADLVARDPGSAVRTVDATEQPDVADRYEIRRAPTVLRAEPGGRVVERLVGPEAVRAWLAGAAGPADAVA